jgi:putative SOS response-associated peptidase YedK
MCGRFTLTSLAQTLAETFDLSDVPDLIGSYNIAPSQAITTLILQSGQKCLKSMKWGLVPFWAKDSKIGDKLINARAETLSEKPSFRYAFQKRRCLILADGFYEWQTIKGKKAKQPYYIRMSDHQPFAFAGLWELWQKDDSESIISCTIITTEANDLVKPIHHRMPVIMAAEKVDQWLDSTTETQALQSLLTPYESQNMMAYPVSSLVNNPRNNQPECCQNMKNLASTDTLD